jgi:uncharacterized protein YdeI (YjbR/CyaY-like superfamily)
MSEAKVKKFKAALEPLDDGLGWVVAWVPFEIATVWPKMVRLRVVVEVAGEQFQTSLFAAKHGVVPEHRRKKQSDGVIPAKNAVRGGHFFVVNKKMQAAAGVGMGGTAEFAMWADLEERKAALTLELAAIFKVEKVLKKYYETKLNDSTRWAIRKWLDEAKGAEARVRRAEQMAERLLETMEAEVSLPPLIETALRRRPGAMEGWEKMTAGKRQSLLMAVFYYRTPESRAKRVEKVVGECLAKI